MATLRTELLAQLLKGRREEGTCMGDIYVLCIKTHIDAIQIPCIYMHIGPLSVPSSSPSS